MEDDVKSIGLRCPQIDPGPALKKDTYSETKLWSVSSLAILCSSWLLTLWDP